MKKKFFLSFFALTALLAGTTLVSCGGDDDGDGGNSSALSPTIVDEQGSPLRLTRAGDVYYYYDEQGKLVGVKGDDGTYTIDGTNITISESDFEETWKLSFNGKGMVTKFSVSGVEDDDDGVYKFSGSASVSYNGNNQITGISGSSSGKIGSESIKSTFTAKYTWTNNNLTAVYSSAKNTGEYKGKKVTEEDIIDAKLEYGTQDNPLRQMPYDLYDEVIDLGVDFGAPLGWFGVGPATFPTKATIKHVDNYAGDEDEYTYNCSPSYTLNDNGTIATERFYSGTRYYTYEGQEVSAEAKRMAQAVHVVKGLRKHNLLRPRLHRK